LGNDVTLGLSAVARLRSSRAKEEETCGNVEPIFPLTAIGVKMPKEAMIPLKYVYLACLSFFVLLGCNSKPVAPTKVDDTRQLEKRIYIHFESEKLTLNKSAPMSKVHFDAAKKLYYVDYNSGKATLFVHRPNTLSSELELLTDEILTSHPSNWQIVIDKNGEVKQSPIGWMISSR
jgi:hypothetical protein